MAPRPWIVPRHDALQKHEPELWTVEADVNARTPMRRRMGIARFADGAVAFFNAVPLRDEVLREVDELGRPTWLCIPAAYHTLDVAAFHARYGHLRVISPAGAARARVARKVPVAGGWELLPGDDPHVRVIPLRGTKGEIAVHAGATLFFPGDAVMNLPHQAGLPGLLLRLLGTSGGPKVTPLARLFVVADRAAFRAHLDELAALPGLSRVVPCHGGIVERDAPGSLRRIAAAL